MDTLLKSAFSLFLVLVLAACSSGGGGGGGDQADTDGKVQSASPSILSLSGADTLEIGGDITLNYYAYRENFSGADQFLSAASTVSGINFARVGMGELEGAIFQPDALNLNEANAAIFNILNEGLSITIKVNGVSYSYRLTCPAGCSGIQFDAANRSVTFENVVVQHVDSPSSESSAPLTISGTLTWLPIDEDPNAPGIGVVEPDAPPTRTSDVAFNDIKGVWKGDFFNEYEAYTVFYDDGVIFDRGYTSYEYRGIGPNGSNCYDAYAGPVEDLGNGQFVIDDMEYGTFYFEGDNLMLESNYGDYVFEPTQMLESDFEPRCD